MAGFDILFFPGDLKKAEAFCSTMAGRGYDLETNTLATLIQLLTKRGESAKAVELFEKSREAGVAPNSFFYNAVIDMYSKSNRLDRAIELYKESESTCGLTNVTLSILIRAYSKAGEVLSYCLLFGLWLNCVTVTFKLMSTCFQQVCSRNWHHLSVERSSHELTLT